MVLAMFVLIHSRPTVEKCRSYIKQKKIFYYFHFIKNTSKTIAPINNNVLPLSKDVNELVAEDARFVTP